MERVAYFFDGFNIYHSLDENKKYHKYKWLDYFKLAQIFTKKSQKIVSVNYFTAYQYWRKDSLKRHREYISVLKMTPINIIWGKYKKVTVHCKKCNEYYRGHREKQTDVNIAIHIIKGALLDDYDTAILGTADTDLLPVVKELKKIPTPKIIGILFPIGRTRYSSELENEADYSMKIKEYHLDSCQLKQETYKIGAQEISKPEKWK